MASKTQHRRRTTGIWIALLLGIAATAGVQARSVTVSSPDRTIVAVLSDDDGALRYSVAADGQAVLAPSPLGIRVDGLELGETTRIGSVQRGSRNTRYRFTGGKAMAIDRANTATVTLNAHGRSFAADLHVADDGVAVRLRLPARTGTTVEADRSGWTLAEHDPPVWATALLPDSENSYTTQSLGSLGAGRYSLPLTAHSKRFWITLSEAAVVDYGDLAIERSANGGLSGVLYADPKGWHTDAAIVQPWRVTIIARTLTDLVNTTLVQNLNPPPSPGLADAAWIRPGRSTWQWLAIAEPHEDDQRQWVDWTHSLGFEYYLVDDGWRAWKRPWQTLADTARYARSQGIGVWLWVHSRETQDAAQRKALLRQIAQTGLVGIKVDFPGPDDRQWSNWYADMARDAAAEKLMVDFHGSAKPSGTERTWPNVLTREAVRGHEWHITRYKRVLAAEHDTILPFTRYVVGPADYTPTVFEPKELVGNSWAHELAQAVLFTSPFLAMGGHPQSYLANPARDVLKRVPATWDETIVLPGSAPGKVAAMARRHGRDWFIAAINGGDTTPMTLTLDFLKRGHWTLTELRDVPARPDAW
ncbi:glycoside hydrolase family 97 protein [Xanthomonas sp. 3058]|uniref:glycoside hydrolase family 97 protein n=1 Tax=Xanthomonas sp. 3058 TaxID=3035314 RepID=UPI0016183C35|nr:glycoside hydrolase family 97 protein [Xanthomonas sp. 3058]MBB5866434.1 alpha-glucosidase [Xanthomonas sp. 3058]